MDSILRKPVACIVFHPIGPFQSDAIRLLRLPGWQSFDASCSRRKTKPWGSKIPTLRSFCQVRWSFSRKTDRTFLFLVHISDTKGRLYSPVPIMVQLGSQPLLRSKLNPKAKVVPLGGCVLVSGLIWASGDMCHFKLQPHHTPKMLSI